VQDAHGLEVVRDEHNRDSLTLELQHAIEAFLLERDVADAPYLVDDEDVGAQMRGDGESEPGVLPDEYRFTGVSIESATPANGLARCS
jgi:hypothetical protein